MNTAHKQADKRWSAQFRVRSAMTSTVSKRVVRLRERQFKRHRQLKGTNYDDRCAICLGSLLEGTSIPIVTLCNHAFHGECWTNYAHRDFAYLQSKDVSAEECFEFVMDSAAGPPCPTCNRAMPLLHHLGGMLQSSDGMTIKSFFPSFPSDAALLIAENK